VKNLKISDKALREICKTYNIVKLSLFGSILSGKFSDKSDIDVLVVFAEGKTPGYLTMARIERELSEIFGGKKIDLRTPSELSRYFRNEVISNAHVRYSE
jgi:hypothetical protein